MRNFNFPEIDKGQKLSNFGFISQKDWPSLLIIEGQKIA